MEYAVLAGLTVWKRDNKVEVRIFRSEELLYLVLRLFPFAQDIREGLWKPHFPNAGFCFWSL